jgi:hypothetical protein
VALFCLKMLMSLNWGRSLLDRMIEWSFFSKITTKWMNKVNFSLNFSNRTNRE